MSSEVMAALIAGSFALAGAIAGWGLALLQDRWKRSYEDRTRWLPDRQRVYTRLLRAGERFGDGMREWNAYLRRVADGDTRIRALPGIPSITPVTDALADVEVYASPAVANAARDWYTGAVDMHSALALLSVDPTDKAQQKEAIGASANLRLLRGKYLATVRTDLKIEG